MRFWSFTFSLIAAVGFGLAAMYASKNQLVGLNVGVGFFAFNLSLLLVKDE